MIIKEVLENGLIHTYSDQGYTILQEDTGIEYGEAYDKVEHKYIETTNLMDEGNLD